MLSKNAVGDQVSVAILLSVRYDYQDAVHTFYKHKFFHDWPCPVSSHSVFLLFRKSIKPMIALTLQIPHDYVSHELCLLTGDEPSNRK